MICLTATSLGACVTSMYPGPRRPDSETMVVETDGTQIIAVDDVEPPNGSRYRLLPGAHHIEVVLDDPKARRSSRLSLPVCFTGRPGHTYLVRPQYHGGRIWRPQVIDENVTYAIASDDCSAPARREIGRAPIAPPPAAAGPPPPDAGVATDESSADAAARSPLLAAAPLPSPDGGPPPAAPATPRPVVGSDDAETPRVAVRTPTPTPAVQPFQPRLDFGVEIGLVQGGEELARATTSGGMTETLGAGDGLLLAFRARVTPWWLADRVGLGIGGGAGIKYWTVGEAGADASMREYTLMATGHALFAATPIWLLLLQGGVEKDYGIDFSINGSSTGIPFESRMGLVADIGAQRALDDHWSLAFSLRVTRLDYAVEDVAVGANSVGITFAIHHSL